MCLYCSNRKFYDSSHCVRSGRLKIRYFVWFILPYKQYSQMFSTFLGIFEKLRKATVSFVMPVCLSACLPACLSARYNSAPTALICMSFYIWEFFRKSIHKIQISLKSDENKGYRILHEDLWACTVISRLFILRMRNVSDKKCRETQYAHYIFNTVLSNIAPFIK